MNEEIDWDCVQVPDEVPLTDKPGGKVIGTARLEKTSNGAYIVHATITDPTYDAIGNGFRLDHLSIAEE
jgi:hypothetical protein